MESRRSPENSLAVGGKTVKIMLLLDWLDVKRTVGDDELLEKSVEEPESLLNDDSFRSNMVRTFSKEGKVSRLRIISTRVANLESNLMGTLFGMLKGIILSVVEGGGGGGVCLPRPWMPNGDIGGGMVRLDVGSGEKRGGGPKIKDIFKEKKVMIPY
ncbi:hypothetical protein Tco_1177963 [Tanacetum coccineum]